MVAPMALRILFIENDNGCHGDAEGIFRTTSHVMELFRGRFSLLMCGLVSV
jgi:hypothetical protein